MDNRTRFYCWLIGKLQHRKMTLEEITDEWFESSGNVLKEKLTRRTFHRYRDGILSQFGLEISCDKHDDYRYYLKKYDYGNSDVTDWMLSALRISSLGDMLKYHSKVMLEQAPGNTEYLDDILSAIDKHYVLRFHYRSPWGPEYDTELVPAFVRLFHQRWYVIGAKPGDESVRSLPFDRIEYLEVVCRPHHLSLKTQRLLNPETFYEDSFGIIRKDDIEPQRIRIRAFYPEYNYIKEVPLHSSQIVLKEDKDGAYIDFELTVRPSRDFLQELLWHGRNLTVLQPESLRLKMVEILKGMTHSYETGEDMSVDE